MRPPRPALALLGFAALLASGCVGPPAAEPEPSMAAPQAAASSQSIAFSGSDWPFLCPPAGGVCVVSGMPTGAEEFEQSLPAGTVPSSFAFDLAWAGLEDPVEFVVEAVCAADEEGDDGCRSDVSLAAAQGELPLHLEASGLELPAGARLVYRVAWQPLLPGMVGGTGQTYQATGAVEVVPAPVPGATSEGAPAGPAA